MQTLQDQRWPQARPSQGHCSLFPPSPAALRPGETDPSIPTYRKKPTKQKFSWKWNYSCKTISPRAHSKVLNLEWLWPA